MESADTADGAQDIFGFPVPREQLQEVIETVRHGWTLYSTVIVPAQVMKKPEYSPLTKKENTYNEVQAMREELWSASCIWTVTCDLLCFSRTVLAKNSQTAYKRVMRQFSNVSGCADPSHTRYP